MRHVLLAATALVGLAAPALADSFGPLVTPAELSGKLETVKPVILDLRAAKPDQSYVPGAISAPYGRFRGPEDNPGALPELAALEGFFEELGLTPDSPIVVVPEGKTDGDFGAAARAYWTLKSTGFTDLTILNGGEQAWRAAGFPTETAPATPAGPSELTLTWLPDWTADTAEVTRIVEGEDEAVLIDARPADFFEGKAQHEAAAKPGTLPGAQSHAYTAFFPDGATTLTPATDVQALKDSLGIDGSKPVVSFCNTGHWAATEWFALSEVAGIADVKLYPGSMVEYSQTGQPMENTPGLLDNALNQIFKG